MALKPCPECGNEVSTKAAACPKCGAPIASEPQPPPPKSEKKSGCGTTIAIALIAVIGVSIVASIIDDTPSSTAKVGPASPPKDDSRSPEMQTRREKLINDLRTEGIFGKVECRNRAADAWVQPRFYTLTFDDKQSFVSVVYAYCFGTADNNSFVTIRDDRSGKDVGTYWGNRGLDLE